MKFKLMFAASLLTISGCDDGLTEQKACTEMPQICNDLNTDGHCNYERSAVIIDRYNEAKLASDSNKYALLMSFEEYNQCIELASKIQHIKAKDKTTSRVQGYVTSNQEIDRLSRETQTSDLPELLYYHWSRNGNVEAGEKFGALEGTKALETPDRQVALAEYWLKRDELKSIRILYHALELYSDDSNIDPEIFRSLVSLYTRRDDYPKAYVWAKIAKHYGDRQVEMEALKLTLKELEVSRVPLDILAKRTQLELHQGTFKSPLK